MPEFCIGIYTYSARPNYHNNFYVHPNRQLSEANIVKNYDHLLHQSLDKIFCERCSSISSSSQFKEFRLDPPNNTDWKSIIKPILEQEPVLSRHFSKEELGRLSLLWISVLAGYEKSAELLVCSGADVNELFGRHDPQVIDEKWTILHALIQMPSSPENERLISLVMDHGADLQVRDYKERTVLHYAVKKNQVQMTEMLLEKGADVEAADDEGMTPLLHAVSKSKANELVPLLVKYGANIFAKDHHGTNALYWFTPQAHELARDFIEKGVSLDDGDNPTQPIHGAAFHRTDELVNLYLDYGANVNALTVHGESPLHIAAMCGNSTVVDTLLKRGANVNLRKIDNVGSRTALLAVCRHASYYEPFAPEEVRNTIRILLSAGADVHIEDFDGKTPFGLFSINGKAVEQPETWLMIKALALNKAHQPSIELKDERIIEQYPKMQKYYHDCFKEIDKMKITKFIHTCTLFDLFSKSCCQIAALMRNPNFETEFEQFDLSGFSTYAEDIRRVFERAKKHYQPMLKQEDVIIEAFYDLLPDLIVDKVVHYIFDCCKNIK